jgi:hypothetical protein
LSQDGTLLDLKPLFAYKGIETTIFTGVCPNVHNVWTEFCLEDKSISRKNFSLLSKMIKPTDLLPNDKSKIILRYAIERFLFQRPYNTPNLIPAAGMPYFIPSQQKRITEPRVLGNIKTLFDFLREKRLPFVFMEPSIWGDMEVYRKAKKLIEQNRRFHFWYLKFNHLDHLGHKLGPSPYTFKDQLTKIDSFAEEIITLLQKKDPKLKVLVLADHGMSEVRASIDILGRLEQLNSQIYKDYLTFADSTMIRFWFFNKKAQQEISAYLEHLKGGHILTNSEKELLKIPLDPKYGETIYVLDEGYIVHPCFFHSKSVIKGMHGYAYTKTPEASPILIMNDLITEFLDINKKFTYADLFKLILHSLTIKFFNHLLSQQKNGSNTFQYD